MLVDSRMLSRMHDFFYPSHTMSLIEFDWAWLETIQAYIFDNFYFIIFNIFLIDLLILYILLILFDWIFQRQAKIEEKFISLESQSKK